jgi:hypothetical protein
VISEAFFQGAATTRLTIVFGQRANTVFIREDAGVELQPLPRNAGSASTDMLDLDRPTPSVQASNPDKLRPSAARMPLAKQHIRDCVQCNIFVVS